jgi:hypothetical protein
MNIPWADIIAMVLKLLEDCNPQPVPEAQILQQIRNPRALQRIRFERGVRETMQLSHAQWRHQGKDIMAEIYADAEAATDEDLRELISRSKAVA